MNAYLDASVVFTMLVRDRHFPRVEAWLVTQPSLAFSLWTLTETSSALSQAVRMKRIEALERRAAEVEMDRLLDPAHPSTAIEAEDFRDARRLVDRHGTLRAPDALHIAIAARNGWTLATLDEIQAEAATRHGVALALP